MSVSRCRHTTTFTSSFCSLHTRVLRAHHLEQAYSRAMRRCKFPGISCNTMQNGQRAQHLQCPWCLVESLTAQGTAHLSASGASCRHDPTMISPVILL